MLPNRTPRSDVLRRFSATVLALTFVVNEMRANAAEQVVANEDKGSEWTIGRGEILMVNLELKNSGSSGALWWADTEGVGSVKVRSKPAEGDTYAFEVKGVRAADEPVKLRFIKVRSYDIKDESSRRKLKRLKDSDPRVFWINVAVKQASN